MSAGNFLASCQRVGGAQKITIQIFGAIMKIWRGQFLASIFIGVSLFLTGCKKPAESAADSPVIKVGEFASLNGSEAAFGRSSHNGTQLAVDEINAAGGVLGKQIQLI